MAIDRQVIKRIMIDNIELIKGFDFIERNILIEEQIPSIFTGVRRSGKSYILYQQMNKLIKQGHDWEEFLYINFEDKRLIEFNINDFSSLLEIFYTLTTKEPILFLDEIQNINGWEKFARRIADEKRKVFIIGSNATMLSREIETTLGGRYMAVPVFPYSYQEFLISKSFHWTENMIYSSKGKGTFLKYFDEYLNYGGFPEVVNLTNKRDYLSSIYNKIFLGDIIARHSLSNVKALEVMMKKIAESIGQMITFSRLTNIVKSVGISVGKSTIIQYLENSKDSYLLFSINNFTSKIVEKTTTLKYYFVDVGLLNLFIYDSDSSLLENLVASHLIRKYGQDNVYYYFDGVEVDFYIPSESLAIQVSYSIAEATTRQRELKALLKLGEYKSVKQKLIITYEEEEIIDIDNTQVEVVPAFKWMLD